MSFELRHRKHIQDELTAIVRRQLRNRARALTTTKRLSEHTYGIFRHKLWSQRAIEAKPARSATASSPKQPSPWRRCVNRRRSGHPLQSHRLA